jgi:hypothetical protein
VGNGNTLGGCPTAIGVSGADAVIRANVIGFTMDGAAAAVQTGVVVGGSGSQVGGPASLPGAGNLVGFADTAIFVGSGSAGPIVNVSIEHNSIGLRPSGEPAPVINGVVLAQPSNGTVVASNTFSNASVGITVLPDAGEVSSVGNTFRGNIFSAISNISVDLGFDGVTNANDPSDADQGPNGMLNHPVISRATQARLNGTSCALCEIQIYSAFHEPGGTHDYGLAPLATGTVFADSAGAFSLDNPPVAPGDWLIALATDPGGNSSEFGPSARVGAGSVLCENIQLQPGWNHVGYFGSDPVPLISTFSPVPSGAVTAIYRFVDGTDTFERWFSTTTVGRTLTSVEPGESYWFYASSAATLPGGFSLSFPVPVELKPGWNDLVYLGASETVPDSLESLHGDFSDLYHFDSGTGQWLRFGGLTVPSWAQQFDRLEACSVYQIRVPTSETLVPLQP